jgi:serralysin
MAVSVPQGSAGDAYIDGLIFGTKWSGSFTFSFPQLATDYQAGNDEADAGSGFTPVTLQQREATRAIMTGQTFSGASNVMLATNVSSFVSVAVSEAGGLGNGLNGAGDIRLGQSNDANPTAHAYFPNNNANGNGGDVWFGATSDYTNPVMGNYAYLTHIHELGHAMGLKHSHELGGVANVAVPSNRDAIEWTVMSYRSFVGGPSSGGYSFGAWDAPQTFMVYDIQSLQTLYAASYDTGSNNTNSTYTWSETTGQTFINGVSQGTPGGNKVFVTVWDGGGIDTYDMSNFGDGVTINLNPGTSSTTSIAQRAQLGAGHQATGNVYNALLFNGDLRSIIENATGGAGNDRLTGNQLANVLTGNGGNDFLNGGAGIDTMTGGTGNDTYFVDAAGDIVIENADEGIDRIYASTNYILAAGEEIETLGSPNTLGVGILYLTGNEFNNNLLGNNGDNTLNSGAGYDRLHGYLGDDKFIVDSAGDRVYETVGGGNDQVYASVSYTLTAGQEIESLNTTNSALAGAINLTGNEFNNNLFGNNGANTLRGGLGADRLHGYLGNDKFVVDNAGDLVFEADGGGKDKDWVYASVSYTLTAGQEIETLTTTNNMGVSAIDLTGNEFDNLIAGNSGDNTLNGGVGGDRLYGYAGNDSYIVDYYLDTVNDAVGGGNDRVYASVNFILRFGQEIETLTTTDNAGVSPINLYGNEFDNLIEGNNGNNGLSGGAGFDRLYGYGGDDSYRMDDAGDLVFEAVGNGMDRVVTTMSYTLPAGQEIETLMTPIELIPGAFTLTGNEFNNTVIGNANKNTINGGAGNDQLTGYFGTDIFLFNTAPNSATNHDSILDFDVANDTIHLENTGAGLFNLLPLGVLSANRFGVFGGQDADDVILYNQATGDLYYDNNGLVAGGQTLFADVTNGLALTNLDFFVI